MLAEREAQVGFEGVVIGIANGFLSRDGAVVGTQADAGVIGVLAEGAAAGETETERGVAGVGFDEN